MNDNKSNFLTQMLSDNSGGVSSMRVAFFLWSLGVLVVWMIVSLTHQDKGLAEINTTVTTVLGLMAGAKVVQRFGENPEEAQKSQLDHLKAEVAKLSAEERNRLKEMLGQ